MNSKNQRGLVGMATLNQKSESLNDLKLTYTYMSTCGGYLQHFTQLYIVFAYYRYLSFNDKKLHFVELTTIYLLF